MNKILTSHTVAIVLLAISVIMLWFIVGYQSKQLNQVWGILEQEYQIDQSLYNRIQNLEKAQRSVNTRGEALPNLNDGRVL